MKLSRRSAWPRDESRLARLVAAARAGPLCDLTESNPTRARLGDRRAEVALLGDAAGVGYAPTSLGLPAARAAVAAYYRERGRSVDAEQVLLSASSSEAYSWLMKLLCDPGDAILTPRPSYPLLDYLADLEGVALCPYSLLRDERWRVDTGAVERLVTARTRAIAVVHPHNPTGALVHPDDRRALLALCARHELALIVDEVFLDYVPPDAPGAVSFAGEAGALCFVLSGLSKVALLPQLKLGWTVVSGPGADEALARLEIIADTYLSVSTAVQLACPELLARVTDIQAPLVRRLTEHLAVVDELCAPPAPIRRVSASHGWYACIEVPRVMSDDAWCELLLEEEGVLVQPGYFFDVEHDGVMVVSLLAPDFADGFARAARRWSAA